MNKSLPRIHFCILGRFYVLPFRIGDELDYVVEGAVECCAYFDEYLDRDYCAVAFHFGNGCGTDPGFFAELLFLHSFVDEELEKLFVACFHIMLREGRSPSCAPWARGDGRRADRMNPLSYRVYRCRV